jgi:hypothetical protein
MHLRVEFKEIPFLNDNSPILEVEIDSLSVKDDKALFVRSDRGLGNWFHLDDVVEWSVS